MTDTVTLKTVFDETTDSLLAIVPPRLLSVVGIDPNGLTIDTKWTFFSKFVEWNPRIREILDMRTLHPAELGPYLDWGPAKRFMGSVADELDGLDDDTVELFMKYLRNTIRCVDAV